MKLRVADAWKTVVEAGYRQQMPIIHIRGCDKHWESHHVPIDGFRPYMLVREQEWLELGEEVSADSRVLDVKRTDRRGRPETAIDGERLFRVVCRTPGDVADVRELFDDPFEADVLYPTRFLIDHDANQWIEVPDSATDATVDDPIHVDDVSIGIEEEPAQTPPIRVATYDIEVAQGGSGPPVVSTEGCEQVRNPITAISAHDSYTDEYRVWCLVHDGWRADDAEAAREAVECEVTLYANPRTIAGKFCEWITQRDVDALLAWAGSGFDHPYFFNWCQKNGVRSVYDVSPTGSVYEFDGDGKWINTSLKGRLLLDLMDMYDKCKVHSLDSKRLEDVAETEGVSVGKLDIESEIDVPRDEPAIDYARRASTPRGFV